MGQKTNPIGLRVAVNKDWRSKWFASKKEFGALLTEDREIREFLKKKLETASVPKILIERATNRCRVTILTARPGVVIGRKGAEIDKLKEELSKKTGKEVYVDIVEVKTAGTGRPTGGGKHRVATGTPRFLPSRDEKSVADREGFRRGRHQDPLRRAVWAARNSRASEMYHWGRVPLHTLRANIDYGFAEALTVYGKLGVKCWICKGENKPQKKDAAAEAKAAN